MWSYLSSCTDPTQKSCRLSTFSAGYAKYSSTSPDSNTSCRSVSSMLYILSGWLMMLLSFMTCNNPLKCFITTHSFKFIARFKDKLSVFGTDIVPYSVPQLLQTNHSLPILFSLKTCDSAYSYAIRRTSRRVDPKPRLAISLTSVATYSSFYWSLKTVFRPNLDLMLTITVFSWFLFDNV